MLMLYTWKQFNCTVTLYARSASGSKHKHVPQCTAQSIAECFKFESQCKFRHERNEGNYLETSIVWVISQKHRSESLYFVIAMHYWMHFGIRTLEGVVSILGGEYTWLAALVRLGCSVAAGATHCEEVSSR